MSEKDNRKLLINRVVAFLAGGLVVWAVMSATVVNNLSTENEELSQAFDASRFEAGRLLEDAKAQFEAGDYTKAMTSLSTLIERQPGSDEAEEGRELLVTIEEAERQADAAWQAAMPEIREQWATEMAAELRSELENSIQETISDAWDSAEGRIRTEWANETQS